jgi:hypothetical protein
VALILLGLLSWFISAVLSGVSYGPSHLGEPRRQLGEFGDIGHGLRVLTIRALVLLALALVSGCGGDMQEAETTGTRQTQTMMSETIDGIEVDLALLPSDLQPLAPLIRKYAAGDDVERTDRLDAASMAELRELDQAMTAERYDAIDEFLNTHIERTGTPEQDVALVLSSFAEATAEAAVTLEERDASR